MHSKGGILVLNQVVLVGRLTEDPTLVNTVNGKKVSSITLAVQRTFKNQDGIYEADFIRCILWNAIAASTTEYCKKGDIVGVKGRIQTSNYEDEKGNRVYSQDYVHEIPFEDYIIQQNVPSHFMKHEQAHGSQDRILTFADMLDVDPYTGETNYLVIDNKKVSVAEAKKNYFQAIADNINDSVQELVRRFNLENEDQRARNEAISEVLQDTILKDSRYGSDLLWACSTNEYGEFNIPLSDPIHSTRIQQLLNSIIKNAINKQEIAGGPVVQVTNFGTSRRLHIRFNDKQGNLLKNLEEYQAEGHSEEEWKKYIEENQGGIAYYEVYAPATHRRFFEDFTDENGIIDVKAIEKLNPDLLKMIGYRIPTEDKYSTFPCKIVGFMPSEAGEAIMLPYEITLITGSDRNNVVVSTSII